MDPDVTTVAEIIANKARRDLGRLAHLEVLMNGHQVLRTPGWGATVRWNTTSTRIVLDTPTMRESVAMSIAKSGHGCAALALALANDAARVPAGKARQLILDHLSSTGMAQVSPVSAGTTRVSPLAGDYDVLIGLHNGRLSVSTPSSSTILCHGEVEGDTTVDVVSLGRVIDDLDRALTDVTCSTSKAILGDLQSEDPA